MDALRDGELQRVHSQAVRLEVPREVGLRDHRLGERPEGVFVRDVEGRHLVDRGALVLRAERREVHRAQFELRVVDEPGDLS